MDMQDLSIYEDLKNGDYQAPSIYLAAMKTPLANPTPAVVRERLEKILQRADVDEIVAVEADDDSDFIHIVISGGHEDWDETENFIFRVRFYANDAPEEWSYEAAEFRDRNLLEDERIEMHRAPQIMECETYFYTEYELGSQTSWALQLAVMDALAGECYALQDMVASTFLSGMWLAETAQTETLPSLDLGYVIHAITPQNPEAADYWLHTHGLLKFGMPELEIMRVERSQVSACQGIIQSVAMRLMQDPESWYEDGDEPMWVVYTEEQMIAVRLIPWQTALASNLLAPVKKGLFRDKVLPFSGDMSDRDDDIHTEPSLVIFADQDGKPQPLVDLGVLLDDEQTHMMLLKSDLETARMHAYAIEKLPLLEQCFHRFAPEEGQWGYIVKIRCESPSTQAVEHMWFTVLEMNGDTVRVQLDNDPFEIPEMQSGEVYTLPTDSITDWRIYSAPWQTVLAPDAAYVLRRYLTAN